MKYFEIDWDYDNINVIGHNPQIEIGEGNNFNSFDNAKNVKPYKFPDFIPQLNLKFHKKAKITNYIERTRGSFGMYVDKGFKEVIEEFNLPRHKFYPLNIKKNHEDIEYYWFHYIIDDFWETIDKDKSKAVIIDIKQNFEEVGTIDLNMNEEEMKMFTYFKLPHYQNVKWKKIILKERFLRYDIYQTKVIDKRTIISENLKNALLNSHMTGFITRPYDIIELE